MFAWIDAEKAAFPITKLCQYLQVSPSGFYAARGRPESARTQTDRTPARPGACLVRREPSAVWQPAYSRGSHRAGGACQSEARHPFNAGRRSCGARAQAVHVHDDERSRSAGRRESLGPLLRGPRSEPALGRRHDGVRHRQQRQALSGRGPRLVLAVRRGLGRERRQ